MRIVKTDLVLQLKSKGSLHEIQVKLPLVTKYNLILGDSASGKTVLEIAYDNYRSSNGLDVIDYAKNKWRYLDSVVVLDYLSDDVKNYDIILVGEELSRLMNKILYDKNDFRHKSLTTSLKDATCKFIFISRHMSTLPIDFKSLFEIVNHNDINVVQAVYKDNTFPFKTAKRYVTEDSGTGFEYYDYHYKNVISAKGNSNLTKVCHSGDTVIADGSAIGNNPILKKSGINLYLPESFEYDLSRAWQPNDVMVTNYLEDMPSDVESVEQYFSDTVLPNLCSKYNVPRYSKCKSLSPVLLAVQIHSKKEYLLAYYKSKNLDYTTQVLKDASIVSSSKHICEHYNVDPNDTDACAYLALQLLSNSESI